MGKARQVTAANLDCVFLSSWHKAVGVCVEVCVVQSGAVDFTYEVDWSQYFQTAEEKGRFAEIKSRSLCTVHYSCP
jgi:hypothetical protein